jgi:hypothetical protein
MRASTSVAMLVVVGATLGSAAPAQGDGLPIPGVTVARGGVAAPGSDTHFTTQTKHGRTAVTRTDRSGRLAPVSISIPGRYTVPAVAIDGSPGGMSADGTTLALIKPRLAFPQSHTNLAVLRTQPEFGLVHRLNLHGDFSFDAISPDGSRLFLIEYLSKTDPTKYAVRALDTISGHLLPHPIVDPHEQNPDEMRGYPITRGTSPDGSWAYTLYSGTKRPFVHALDTASGQAHCIDLPKLASGSVYSDHLRMSPDGANLTLIGRKGDALAVIDTGTLEARAPTEGPLPEAPVPGGATDWTMIAVGVLGAALAAVALALSVRRRRGAVAPAE